jgi:hypothetical protein
MRKILIIVGVLVLVFVVLVLALPFLVDLSAFK